MTNLASNLPLVATIIYFSIVALLSLLAIHRYVVARASWQYPWKDPSPVEVDPESLPHVLLQLPLYNEAQVVGRLIDTVAELSYPSGSTNDPGSWTTRPTKLLGLQLSMYVEPKSAAWISIMYVDRVERASKQAHWLTVWSSTMLPSSPFWMLTFCLRLTLSNSSFWISETIRLVRFRLAGVISTARSLF